MLNIPFTRRASLPILCFVAAALFTAPHNLAQATSPSPAPTATAPSTVTSLAQRIATALDARKTKRVAIPDFAAANGEPTMDKLGAKLAADFRAALEQQPHKFQIVSDAELTALLTAHLTVASDMQNVEAASWLLHEQKIDAWVVGVLGERDDNVVLSIGTFHREKDRALNDGNFEQILGPSSDVKPLDSDLIAPPTTVSSSHSDKSQLRITSPYKLPSCEYCPSARYSDDCIKAHLNGYVSMSVTITADGRPENIQVLKRMPLGLTEQAIATLKTWRFNPATNSDGTPVPAQQTVEMQFHLN